MTMGIVFLEELEILLLTGKVKKKLLAMVRQFGVPTLFLTISAAEVQCITLLILLSEVVDKKKLTELEAENLPYDIKTRLIQSDPFICATYFGIKLK
ncbi:unnamed protein product [Parnassius apollo]|uniref:(apollo) hypothetical protein n=1 Tax=Parnassius apollo TaxID=110799 RepID=A0A8S3XRZ7_PARAO|nr:unnamed protein product [Parnassius apollo]